MIIKLSSVITSTWKFHWPQQSNKLQIVVTEISFTLFFAFIAILMIACYKCEKGIMLHAFFCFHAE